MIPPTRLSTGRRRQVALVGLSIGQLVTILDATAVNVALPSIQHDLHISQAGLSWVVNAYLITFGGFLLVAGRVGDLVGRKKVFIVGLSLFILASLVCGLAGSAGVLIAARFVQGIGAAIECAMVLGIIVSLYPNPRERAGAVGVYAFIGAAGGSIGLLVGGALTQALSWHWIFFINLPFGLAALAIALTVLDEHEGLGISRGVDVVGGFLVTGAALLAVYGFVVSSTDGWTSPATVASLCGSAALATAFVIVEHFHHNPLVPRRVLHSRNLVCAGAVRALFSFGSYGTYFLLVLYLQQVLRFGPIANGLAFLPSTILISVLSLFVTPRLMGYTGGKAMMSFGLVVFAVGIALLIPIPAQGTYMEAVFPSMVLLGIAGGTFNVPNVTLAMAESAEEDSGLVSGVINVSQQLGAAMGVAVLASVSASRTQQELSAGVAHALALTNGFRVGFIVGTTSVLAAAAASLLVRSRRVSTHPGPAVQAAIQVTEVDAL
jgi:EmrB/QacA subfamily drug resistance transporter